MTQAQTHTHKHARVNLIPNAFPQQLGERATNVTLYVHCLSSLIWILTSISLSLFPHIVAEVLPHNFLLTQFSLTQLF